MNRIRNFAIVAGVATVVLFGWIAWRPLAIWLHRHELVKCLNELHAASATERAGGTSRRHSSDWFKRRTYHCERLVALGYFFHVSYEMDNLPDSDAVYYAIMDRWMREFPSSPYSTMQATDYVFDVYDVPENKPKWDAFFRKYNVADFVDRFVSSQSADGGPKDAGERG